MSFISVKCTSRNLESVLHHLEEFLHNSLRIRIKLRFLPKFLPEGMSPDNKYCAYTFECLSKFAIDNRTDNIVSRTL